MARLSDVESNRLSITMSSPLINYGVTSPYADGSKEEAARWMTACQMLEDAEDLPTAPPIAFKILSLMRRSDYDNNDLVEVIRYDSELTAKLLKICNSALYRPAEPIMSINQALLRLGQIVVYEQVLTIAMGRTTKGKTARSHYGQCAFDVWRRSVASAAAARYLGPRCAGIAADRETCFTVGLLHNIGQIVLSISPLPAIAQIPLLTQDNKMSLVDAEREALGTDHAAIGGALLQKWNLPQDVVNAVRYYLEPDLDNSGLANVAHLADFCSLVGNGSWQQMQTDMTAHVAEKVGLQPSELEETLNQLKKEAAAIEAFVMVAM